MRAFLLAIAACLCAAGATLAAEPQSPVAPNPTFGGPFGVAVNSRDVIYVADINRACVVKLDAAGRVLGQIDDIPGYGKLRGPFDVQVGPDDAIYIADTRAHQIIALDAREQLRFVLGNPVKGAREGEFAEPHFLAVTPEGDLLVADTFNARIQRFDRNGKFIRAWGRVGAGPGEFLHHGYVARLDVDAAGNVYVREFDGGRIQKYAADGTHLATFSRRGSGEGELDEGYGLKVIDGKLYCPDTFESRIQVFSLEGKLLEVWAPGEGDDGDRLNHPVGIAALSTGELIVTDWKNGRVVKMDKSGRVLARWGAAAGDLLAWKPPSRHARPDRGPVQFAVYAGVDERTVARARQAGVSVIYPSIDLQYRPWNLAPAVSRAASAGVEVHPSIACLPFGQGTANSDVFARHSEWLMWKRGAREPLGTLLGWSSPGARSFRADHIVAQVKESGVQGVMLDYIRYLGTDYGYDPAAVAEFRALHGVDPNDLPQDDPRWMQFRADYVTAFIVELRHKLAKEIPGRHVEISVYLSGDDPAPDQYLRSSLQDWRTWASMGIVDTLHVAHYTRDFDQIFHAVRRVREAVPGRTKVNCFIAAYGGNLNTPELLAKGVEAATAAGADMVTVYRGDAIDELNLWPALEQVVKQQ